ncbi:MAG: hypothetical protein QW292_14300 [Candidatus Parvarchaeota archaeon]
MMIKRQGNVPKVTIHPVRIAYHPLITQPTKGAIYPKEIIHGIPNFPWLKKGTGPVNSTIPITPGNIIRPHDIITRYITPYHPISPINDYRKPPTMPYHPITPIIPYHPITIKWIHPTQIIQKKVQKTVSPPPSQPDTSAVTGAEIGALMSILLAFL